MQKSNKLYGYVLTLFVLCSHMNVRSMDPFSWCALVLGISWWVGNHTSFANKQGVRRIENRINVLETSIQQKIGELKIAVQDGNNALTKQFTDAITGLRGDLDQSARESAELRQKDREHLDKKITSLSTALTTQLVDIQKQWDQRLTEMNIRLDTIYAQQKVGQATAEKKISSLEEMLHTIGHQHEDAFKDIKEQLTANQNATKEKMMELIQQSESILENKLTLLHQQAEALSKQLATAQKEQRVLIISQITALEEQSSRQLSEYLGTFNTWKESCEDKFKLLEDGQQKTNQTLMLHGTLIERLTQENLELKLLVSKQNTQLNTQGQNIEKLLELMQENLKATQGNTSLQLQTQQQISITAGCINRYKNRKKDNGLAILYPVGEDSEDYPSVNTDFNHFSRFTDQLGQVRIPTSLVWKPENQ